MRKASIVIGANLGDEGKGTIVARLTKPNEKTLNILTNGGSQRGHSILTRDGSMTFQHFGSGTYFGADNYYSPWFILNPMQFVSEYQSLIVKPKQIYRDKRCRWSTPYDVMANQINEEFMGRKASCGMGIWMTIKRSSDFRSLPFDVFMSLPYEKRYQHLLEIKAYYEHTSGIMDSWKDTWDSETLIHHFLNDCAVMNVLTTPADFFTLDYEHYVFENGQGLLLTDTGRDEYDTTPSNTGIAYASVMCKEAGLYDVTAHYVTRPYMTRHGDGDMKDPINRILLSSDICEDRTNHYNEHQGEFRYGELNVFDLCDRIRKDVKGCDFVLDVTHCDEMDITRKLKQVFDEKQIITHDTALVL